MSSRRWISICAGGRNIERLATWCFAEALAQLTVRQQLSNFTIQTFGPDPPIPRHDPDDVALAGQPGQRSDSSRSVDLENDVGEGVPIRPRAEMAKQQRSLSHTNHAHDLKRDGLGGRRSQSHDRHRGPIRPHHLNLAVAIPHQPAILQGNDPAAIPQPQRRPCSMRNSTDRAQEDNRECKRHRPAAPPWRRSLRSTDERLTDRDAHCTCEWSVPFLG